MGDVIDIFHKKQRLTTRDFMERHKKFGLEFLTIPTLVSHIQLFKQELFLIPDPSKRKEMEEYIKHLEMVLRLKSKP